MCVCVCVCVHLCILKNINFVKHKLPFELFWCRRHRGLSLVPVKCGIVIHDREIVIERFVRIISVGCSGRGAPFAALSPAWRNDDKRFFIPTERERERERESLKRRFKKYSSPVFFVVSLALGCAVVADFDLPAGETNTEHQWWVGGFWKRTHTQMTAFSPFLTGAGSEVDFLNAPVLPATAVLLGFYANEIYSEQCNTTQQSLHCLHMYHFSHQFGLSKLATVTCCCCCYCCFGVSAVAAAAAAVVVASALPLQLPLLTMWCSEKSQKRHHFLQPIPCATVLLLMMMRRRRNSRCCCCSRCRLLRQLHYCLWQHLQHRFLCHFLPLLCSFALTRCCSWSLSLLWL